ncbi:MAG: serine--tRNA ligase [Thermoplasmata archaeon]|nr:serine--tRNA ligase [Thermoplasmata archaeon]
MLDIKLIREKPEYVKERLAARCKEYPIEKLLDVDRQWREITGKVVKLRAEKNKMARLISKSDDRARTIAEVEKINAEIEKCEGQLAELDAERNQILAMLPNLPHESVPTGPDENSNVVLREWGTIPEFSFKPRDHIELGEKLGLIDVERAGKVSGARFAYLKKELVFLEFAIVQFALRELVKEGFVPVLPPVLVREMALFGTGFLPTGREDVYKIEGEDLYLAGTAEVPIGAMHADEIFEKKELPKYYAGFSTCFRTEAGAHGRDTKGIFRVHQFDKIEMFKFVLPETSWEEHEKLLGSAENLVRKLKLPYRVVNIASGELGPSAAKKYDIEVYLPGQGKYREMVSCSNCTDYQARRLNIRYRDADGLKYVHTLNSTALAIGRTIVAIMENYQTEESKIEIPEVLREHLHFKTIG